jgi:hypothetical protein
MTKAPRVSQAVSWMDRWEGSNLAGFGLGWLGRKGPRGKLTDRPAPVTIQGPVPTFTRV